MKKRLVLVMMVFLLLLTAGCKNQAQTPTEPAVEPTVPTVPEPTPAEIFTDAAESLTANAGLKMKLESLKTTSVGTQDFTEKSSLTLSVNGMGSDAFIGKATGVIRYTEEQSVMIEEYCVDGTVYGEMEGAYYTAPSNEADFFARYAPPVLLDPALYETVEFTDDNTLAFSGATAPEAWLGLEEGVEVDASGTASFENGILVSTSYQMSYRYGSADIALDITVKTEAFSDTLEAPDGETHSYLSLSDPRIPLIIERARGALLQSESLSFLSREDITCSAANLVMSTNCDFNLVGSGESLQTNNMINVTSTDTASGSTYTYSLEELYADGVMSYIEDGGERQVAGEYSGEAVWASYMAGYYRFADQDKVLNLENVSSLTFSEVPGGYVLDFTYTDAWTKRLHNFVCEQIFEDPKVLDENATAYELLTSGGYISIDAVTGLLTADSRTYSATHVIDGYVYPLRMDQIAQYDAASLTAYEAITGEQLPETEEKPQATPLFYKVTGENGETMWLFGTIHIGDSRTSNLPEEIYTALEASDALALEYDMNQFDRQLEEDDALMQQVLSTYIYADGSTISQHLTDPNAYVAGKQLLKFAGQYNMTSDYMRPSVWSGTIENFYMDLGYRLSADYGVDVQLLELAESQGKTVKNVESGIEQARIISGFSEGLQEYMLISTLQTTPAEYNAQVEALYELWCVGDESQLTEYLTTSDTEELTGQELAYAQEYTQAIETDRNANMLEVATGYLNSGETVFYAVGLAHLLAEDGLVNTLRAAGYTVELVTYE